MLTRLLTTFWESSRIKTAQMAKGLLKMELCIPTIQKFGVCKICLIKNSQNSNIVKYYYSLK